MTYDFDVVHPRRNKGAAKWDTVNTIFGENSNDVIPLALADMDFKTAPEIINAIHRFAEEGIYGYTNPIPGYFDSVINWMERRHSWKLSRDWISLSPGIIPALYAAVRAFTAPGDQILIQPPVYYPFPMAITDNNRTVIENQLKETNGRYTIDFADLEAKLSEEKTTMMILCSPHNPVARVWTAEELRTVASLCHKYGVILVADEVHHDLVYQGYKHTPVASIDPAFEEFCVILTAPSKTFNLAGMQVANIIIPNAKLRERFKAAFASIGIRRLNYFAFPACRAAYDEAEPWLEQLIDYLDANMKMAIGFIKEKLPMLKVTEPEGTYFLWIDCRALGMSDEELHTLFRQKARILPDEGYIFGKGGSGFERINIACPAKILAEVLERIEKAVNSSISQ